MRKFLYVRIAAIISVVVVLTNLTRSVYIFYKYWNFSVWWQFSINLLFIGSFAFNGLILLYLYDRHYPDKIIPTALMRTYRVSYVMAILQCGFSVFALVMNFLEGESTSTFEVFAFSTLLAAYLVQLIGGKKMVQYIRLNARKQLEDSFA